MAAGPTPLGALRVAEIEPGSAAYEDARELRYAALYAPLELPRDLVDDTDEHRYVHFAAWAGGRMVGYARLDLVGGASQAYQVAVVSERRGGGVGSALMTALHERAREQGRDFMELDARVYAVGFYERLGYEVVSEEFLSPRTGTPHRRMRRVL